MKPNLFVVGAPKCGTTSLHEYLNNYDEIEMSSIKEPCFFAQDFQSKRYIKDKKGYENLWSGASVMWRGESTTSYLFSETAAEEIYEYNNQAKVIIILRHPQDLMRALHSEYVKTGIESEAIFEKALELQKARALGKELPLLLEYPARYLQYEAVANYLPQVERFLSVFGRDNILFISFENLVTQAASECKAVLAFLGLPFNKEIHFPTKNRGKEPRSMRLHKVLTSFAGISSRTLRPVLRSRRVRRWMRAGYQRIIDANLVEKAAGELEASKNTGGVMSAQDVDQLRVLTGLSLSDW